MADPVIDIVRALEERIALLTAARDALTRYMRLGPLHEIVPSPPAYLAPNLATPAAPEVRRARPSDAGGASKPQGRILAALKASPSMKAGAIATATGIEGSNLRYHLGLLVKTGRVKAFGATSGRTYALA